MTVVEFEMFELLRGSLVDTSLSEKTRRINATIYTDKWLSFTREEKDFIALILSPSKHGLLAL